MIDTSSGAFWGFMALIVNVLVGGIVSSWALRRRVQQEAAVTAEEQARRELSEIHKDDRERIERLERRVDGREREIRSLHQQLHDAQACIAAQAERIRDLEETASVQAAEISDLKAELAECVVAHRGVR